MKIIKSSLFGLLLTVAITVLAYLLYHYVIKKDSYVLLDNPTERMINVFVDDDKYTLAAFQNVKLNIPSGSHMLKVVRNDSILLDSVFVLNNENAIINPLMANYFVVKQYYGRKSYLDSIIGKVSTIVEDETYKARIEVRKDICIDGFDLNLDQSFPKILKADTLAGLNKIFRPSQFKWYYKDNYK